MIKDSFTYIAVLIFAAAVLVYLPRLIKGNAARKFFSFAPPVVLIYLGLMALCTLGAWDLQATSAAYSSLKNPLLYAMLFIMLLRCDLRKILRLGPKMLLGFLAATVSISLGFVVSFAIMRGVLGEGAWKSLGALCGSWMGGGGNMLAIQAALDIDESAMAYALVMDSICGTLYIMFLLWAIGFSDKFDRWTKADTTAIHAVGASLEQEYAADSRPLAWQNILLLTGSGLLVAAVCTKLGGAVGDMLPFFDRATWTVLIVTVLGILLAMTPFGKLRGTEEVSNVLLYVVIALIASRADLRYRECSGMAGGGAAYPCDTRRDNAASREAVQAGYIHLRSRVACEYRWNRDGSDTRRDVQQCAGSRRDNHGAARLCSRHRRRTAHRADNEHVSVIF